MDTNMSGTSAHCGPWELRALTIPRLSLAGAGSPSGPWWTSTAPHGCHHWSHWLETNTCLSTRRGCQGPGFVLQACSNASVAYTPPLCGQPVCDSTGFLGRSPLINLALWEDTNVCEWLVLGMLLCSRQYATYGSALPLVTFHTL